MSGYDDASQALGHPYVIQARAEDAEEIRALRARVAELEAERDRERASVPYTLGAEAMRERLQRDVHRRLVAAWDERCRAGMPYELRHAVEALDEACALPLTDDAREDGGSDG